MKALLEESAGIRAEIPEAYRSKRLNEYRPGSESQATAFNITKRFVLDFDSNRKAGKSLIITGGIGTGKTHLACAVLRAVVVSGKSGLYTTAAGMFRRIKSTWGKQSDESETQAFNAFVDPDLLVIDEVGIQQGGNAATANELTIFTELIDRRGWDAKPTILVTNLAQAELPGWVGERVISRLLNNGGMVVPVAGSDWRRKNG